MDVRPSVLAALALVAAGVAFGCIYDPDAPCGPNQELTLARECVCMEGYTLEEGACVPAPAAAPVVAPDPNAPSGLGTTCSSAADCADFEASYCEAVLLRKCVIPGCTVAPDDCYDGWDCCDLSSFGLSHTICVPANQCPTQ